jgi:hypothetical protein
VVRHWDNGDSRVPIRASIVNAAEAIPEAVHQTIRQTAAYVFNPAIVQQLWPPPPLASIPLSNDSQRLPFDLTAHKEATFNPASTRFSQLRTGGGVCYFLPTAILCPVIDVFLAIATYISAHSLRSVTSFSAAFSLSDAIASAGNFWPYQQISNTFLNRTHHWT